jgi:hypothetical protein
MVGKNTSIKYSIKLNSFFVGAGGPNTTKNLLDFGF